LFPDFLQLRALFPVLFLLTLAPVPLYAELTTVTPSVSLREEYNDNVFSQLSDRHGDFITTLAPALEFSRSSERGSAVLAGGLSELLYLRNSSSDALGFFARSSGNYALTPRLVLSADLGGSKDSSASSINPATSLVTTSRILHQNYRLGAKYQASEPLSCALSVGLGRDDYDSPAYLDTKHFLAGSTIVYDLGRLFPGTELVQALNLNRDTTDISQVDTLGATLGLSKSLNEFWQVSLSGGGNYSHSRFRAAGAPAWGTHDEGGAVGNLSLGYGGERLSGSLTLSQNLVSASGRSGATQRTGGTLSLSEKLTPRLSGSLGAGYARNWAGQDQLGSGAIDERYRNLTAALRYDFFGPPGDLALEASYAYTNVDYHLLGQEMNQNIVMVRLVWQHLSFR
jgi:hypothetical protein